MGQAESSEHHDGVDGQGQDYGAGGDYARSWPAAAGVHGGAAFHVLRVAERSPAADGGVDPFFDFVVGVNGKQIVSSRIM